MGLTHLVYQYLYTAFLWSFSLYFQFLTSYHFSCPLHGVFLLSPILSLPVILFLGLSVGNPKHYLPGGHGGMLVAAVFLQDALRLRQPFQSALPPKGGQEWVDSCMFPLLSLQLLLLLTLGGLFSVCLFFLSSVVFFSSLSIDHLAHILLGAKTKPFYWRPFDTCLGCAISLPVGHVGGRQQGEGKGRVRAAPSAGVTMWPGMPEGSPERLKLAC